MTVRITTTSGTVYLVRGETVTRAGTTPVDGYDRPIAADTMLDWAVPLVGWAWRFRTAAGPFTTTPVVTVEVTA